MSADDLCDRRARRDELKAKYQDGLAGLLDEVRASWRPVWVDDCRKKGRTIPFAEWCFIPLDPDDPMSSPFEIANVYGEPE